MPVGLRWQQLPEHAGAVLGAVLVLCVGDMPVWPSNTTSLRNAATPGVSPFALSSWGRPHLAGREEVLLSCLFLRRLPVAALAALAHSLWSSELPCLVCLIDGNDGYNKLRCGG